MTSDAIIALSVVVEPWIAAVLVAVVVVLAVRALRRRDRPRDASDALDAPMNPRTERILLAVVVVAAAAVRVVGWDDGLTPVFWFSQAPTLHVGRMLDDGSLWTSWWQRFRTTQVGWPHESVILLPLLAGLQAWLGPRFGVPVLAGAIVGTSSVLLAWALGRRMRSPAFGLLFAAFVAFSPLQIGWARLGAYYVGAVPHVLLALLVGHAAGRRGSVMIAALAGVVAWASLYHYYVARVAIPLAAIAMVAGMGRFMPASRRMLLLGVWLLTFAGIGYGLVPGTIRQAFWPAYGGYAGNKGERSITEFVARNVADFREQGRLVPERYFVQLRTASTSFHYAPGLQYGGLALLPTAIFGAIGIVVVLRRLRRQWLWLALAAAGLALPIVSVVTARRLLVFDLAWCAFAAHGLLAVVEGFGVGSTCRHRAVAAGVAVGLLGIWSTIAVFSLSASLPAGSGQTIPFGEAGFGDGLACKRCLEAGKEWRRELDANAFVVLFDNDQHRENRTSPGGLVLYGKMAAFAAGRPGSFIEAYSLMAGWEGEPPTPGWLFDAGETDFASFLIARIEGAAPARIVWQFERPTLWERWLAGRLAAAGGTIEAFPTALSATPGVRVTTPWADRAGAFRVLRELAAGSAPGGASCVQLAMRDSFGMAGPVFVMAPLAGGDGPSPPEWLATSWQEVRLGTYPPASHPTVIGVDVSTPGRVGFVSEFGRRASLDVASGKTTPDSDSLPGNPGLNCVAHADGHWWTVDPLAGKVTSTHPKASGIPPGQWIGAARGLGQELVLVSADQALVLFDPTVGRGVARFPARVSPSVRATFDECTQVAVGADWIATANLRTAVVSFYDRTGHLLGDWPIDRVMRGSRTLSAIAGAGRYLGVGTSTGRVATFEIEIDPACAAMAGATD